MKKHYKDLLDQLDDLMISLTKQKHLGLDTEVVKALKNLTKSRNAFKREFIKKNIPPKEERRDTVFTSFLDNVADNAEVKHVIS